MEKQPETADILRTTDAQAARHVAAELQQHIAGISAAFEVWSDAMFTVRRMVQLAQFAGDLPDAAQSYQATCQVGASMFEAYARARVQCAIAHAYDGVDTSPAFDAHWVDTWGADHANAAARQWREKVGEAHARQHAARVNAAAASEALRAAGQ